MKNLFKKIFLLLMVCILSVTSIDVYAGSSPSGLSKTGKKRAKELYQYLISNGYTPESACGVLANADQESGFDKSIDCGGTYKGTFQFVSSVASAIKSWAEKKNLDPNSSMVQYQWIEKNKLESDFTAYTDLTLAKFKKLTNAVEACDAFCAAYERCVTSNTGGNNAKNCQHATYEGPNQYYSDLKTRRKYAKEFLKAYANIEAVDSDGSNKITSTTDKNGNDTSNVVVQNGTYGIIDPATGTFQSLADSALEFSDVDDLSQDQLKGVVDWKNNIDYKNDNIVLKFIRTIVMFLGILFLVWMLVIYLSYWFDRINNFIDIDILPMVTAGKLRVSPEEFECTFNPKEFVTKRGVQTVNHRTILTICVIGVFFAVFVITGKMYEVLNFLIRKLLKFLGL